MSHGLLRRCLDHSGNDVFFAAEVVVQAAGGDRSLAADVVSGRLVEAVTQEAAARRVYDLAVPALQLLGLELRHALSPFGAHKKSERSVLVYTRIGRMSSLER
jgi:hypothetical protein